MLLIPLLPVALLLAGAGQGMRAKSIEASLDGEDEVSTTFKVGSFAFMGAGALVILSAVVMMVAH